MNYNLTFPVVVLKDENDSVPYMAYIPYFDVIADDDQRFVESLLRR